MSTSPYCASAGPEGFRCILLVDHADAECLSLDNRKLWKGTPGAPVRWPRPRAAAAEVELPRTTTGEVPVESLDPMLTQGEAGILPSKGMKLGPGVTIPGYSTGEACPECGSLSTQRSGPGCLKCLACGAQGGCG
jgi:hypothetical protein